MQLLLSIIFLALNYPLAAFGNITINNTENLNKTISSPWIISIEKKSGLPYLIRGGENLLSSNFSFWGENWKWAGLTTKLKTANPENALFIGKNKKLDFIISSEFLTSQENTFEWQIELYSETYKSNIIGGGIEFKFNLEKYENIFGKPKIIDTQGWTWGDDKDNQMSMTFSPPLPKLAFVKGKNNIIRASLYSQNIPKGKIRYSVTLKFPKHFSNKYENLYQAFNNINSNWAKNQIPSTQFPIDLSFLNKLEAPAGKHGFLKVRKDEFIFEDGTPVKFWGTNVTANAIFKPSKALIQQHAKRLSKMGFNLVRFHHHDSPWVNPNIFGNKKSKSTLSLSPKELDKLDWWIKCLKEEGIYTWLDLHVERKFKTDDNIYAFEELQNKKNNLKGYNYVNASMKDAMKNFNSLLLTHKNPYTNTEYRNEPAIVALLITNENDITNHFGNKLLPNKKAPKHNDSFMKMAKSFALRWSLPVSKIWRTWEEGFPKLFLNDLEYNFNAEMLEHLRTLNVNTPIATTNFWGKNPLSSLPSLTAGDFIDTHSYGDEGELSKNPIVKDNMIHRIASAHLVDKPITVSEWNVTPFPANDRNTSAIYIAANAAHQGWDAIIQYAYSQWPFRGSKTSNWAAFNDPSLLATLPAAALAYRKNHISEAESVYVFSPTYQQLFFNKLSAGNSAALRTAAELGKVQIVLPETKELPWLKKNRIPLDSKIIHDPSEPLFAPFLHQISSDNKELARNWDDGVFLINTEKTQGIIGNLRNRQVKLKDVDISLENNNASVIIQSMDDNAIRNSKHILITFTANSLPSIKNKLPFYSELINGKLLIRAIKGLKLHTIPGSNNKPAPVSYHYDNNHYHIELKQNLNLPWLILSIDKTIYESN